MPMRARLCWTALFARFSKRFQREMILLKTSQRLMNVEHVRVCMVDRAQTSSTASNASALTAGWVKRVIVRRMSAFEVY